jgi:Ca-activated chloride channel family protein
MLKKFMAPFFAAFLLSPCVAPQLAAASERIVIVLDASGSMWAKLGNETRIAAAKRAVEQIVKGIPEDTELGLIAYGHRRRGDCDDIEVLVMPNRGTQQSVIAATSRLNPRGKTPLSAAVKMAAEVLGHTEQKATVILVSDGEETCDADPCEVGRALAEAGVEFRAHVVGFAIQDPKIEEQLRCLAKATGAEYFDAKDAGSLVQALAGALKSAGAQVETPQETPAPVVTPTPAPTPAGPPALRISVHLSEDGPALEQFHVRVLRPSTQEDGEDELIQDVFTSPFQPAEPLEPGDYILAARLGLADSSTLITYPSNAPAKIVLHAGRVRPTVLIADSPEALDGVLWDFTSVSDPRQTFREYGLGKEVVLPAGLWNINVRLGTSQTSQQIEVKAGETHEPELRLETGVLVTKVQYSPNCEDAPTDGIVINVMEPAKSDLGEPQPLETSYTNGAEFRLSPGKYLIRFRLGYAQGEQEAEIRSGQKTSVNLDAKAGVLAVSVKEPFTSYEVFHRRKALDGTRRSVIRHYHAENTDTLAAGSYVVLAYGPDDQTKEVEVEVKECEREEVVIGP